MKKLMRMVKKPLLFTLALLPVAIVGAIFTCLYQFDMYSPEIMEEAISQIGSEGILIAISVVQVCMYVLFCGFFGYILADKIGLIKPLKFEKKAVIKTIIVTIAMGLVFSLDYWVFGGAVPLIKDSTEAGLTFNGIMSSILYGGMIEEVMMRLFVMSLFVFIIWKVFFKKKAKEEIPTKVFVIANIVAALLFAAGHLPATVILFGELTPMILFRCFLLNGGFAIVFGHLYRKHGIQYAMLSHMGVHIISKLIWILFV